MISHQKKESNNFCRSFLRIVGAVVTASSMLATPLMAADNSASNYTFSGVLDTTFRMRTDIEKKKLLPLYEYLHFDLTNNLSDGAVASFYLGAWGRADLADKSGDKYTDGDLQYAYLSYRAAKNNTTVSLGRQFINEGVATERLDGLYIRSDFVGGIGTAVFGGKPVITEPSYKGADLAYGARITQSDNKHYTVGLSVLKNEKEGAIYREEEGFDLWLHPIMYQADFSGRSTYNSLTEGWMEHAYLISVTPMDKIRISADFSRVNYFDYFYNMTTTALTFDNRTINPHEKLTTGGTSLSYLPMKDLTLSVDYKLYSYDIEKDANYYGGKVSYSLPKSYSVGFGVHQMDGKNDRLRYIEYRGYASRLFGKTNLSVDLTNIRYEVPIIGVKNSISINGAAGYDFNEKLKFGGSIEYFQSPDFNHELRGLLNLTYLFETKRVKGGSSNEK